MSSRTAALSPVRDGDALCELHPLAHVKHQHERQDDDQPDEVGPEQSVDAEGHDRQDNDRP